MLADVPDRELVAGAVTRPWEANVTFRALPPDQFAAFNEPGYVKIAWTLRADPISPTESVFRTETRVMATDPGARSKFRRYWSFLSPGIIVIRWAVLGPLKREAERRASVTAIQRGRSRPLWASIRATTDERARALPGDEQIPRAIDTLTHGVTIRRAPRDVWPWLVQMGAGSRGGWYSYDWLDNGRQPSAARIVPELQHPAIGTIFPALPGMTRGIHGAGDRTRAGADTGLADAGGHATSDVDVRARGDGDRCDASARARSWRTWLSIPRVAVAAHQGSSSGSFTSSSSGNNCWRHGPC